MEWTQEKVFQCLPERRSNTHKGDYGKILMLCGSVGYTGAPALAAMGALRSGAGLVYLGVPESIYSIEAVKLTEAMVFPLPEMQGCFHTAAAAQIPDMLTRFDVVLIGPGCRNCAGTRELVRTVLTHFNGPVILDADGINVLQDHMDILRGKTCPVILTPHDGEFARICQDRLQDRVQETVTFAAKYHVVVLRKGPGSIITDGITVYRNPTGNPGMAVGGSGDVLSGIIAALAGQGLSPLDAAACGAWIHGKAGDLCAQELGQYGMLPTDMLQMIPRLLK